MKNKAYIFLAEGFEEIEAIAPTDILRRSIREVYLVSIGTSLEVKSAHQVCVKADMNWEEFVERHASTLGENREKTAIVFPGGLPGAENLAACKALMEITAQHWAENGLVCAICASPGTILPHFPIEGRKFTGYPGFEEKAIANGAQYTGDSCTQDGNLITANGPGSAMEFGYAIAATLTSENAIEVLKSGMMY